MFYTNMQKTLFLKKVRFNKTLLLKIWLFGDFSPAPENRNSLSLKGLILLLLWETIFDLGHPLSFFYFISPLSFLSSSYLTFFLSFSLTLSSVFLYLSFLCFTPFSYFILHLSPSSNLSLSIFFLTLSLIFLPFNFLPFALSLSFLYFLFLSVFSSLFLESSCISPFSVTSLSGYKITESISLSPFSILHLISFMFFSWPISMLLSQHLS